MFRFSRIAREVVKARLEQGLGIPTNGAIAASLFGAGTYRATPVEALRFTSCWLIITRFAPSADIISNLLLLPDHRWCPWRQRTRRSETGA